jgi:serine/threonine protein kinase
MLHISHGHFSDVFVRHDRVLKQARASVQSERHVYNELRVLSKMAHPNIVALRGFRWESGSLTLVLEHGGQDWFSHGEHDSPDLFRGVLCALKHLHSHRVCHRDLKFDNVLVSVKHESKVAKLCDFGFAHCYADGEPDCSLTNACGSRLYVAPEVLLGGTHSGMCVDVWTLGVMLFLGHTERFALPEGKAFMTAVKYLAENEATRGFCAMARAMYDKPLDLAPDVQEVVDACLKVRPSRRKTAEDLASLDFFSSSEC